MINTEQLNIEASGHDNRDLIIESINNPRFEFPKELDLRDDMPKVWDQGVDGPCSAYAVSAIKSWQEYNDYGNKEPFSRFFVYNLRKNYPAKGMTPRDTMKILHKYGIPYRSSFKRRWNEVSEIPQEVLTEALNHKILGYARIMTIDGLKKSIYKNGPAYIAMPVYNEGDEFWKAQHGQRPIGGHAAVIVGYNQHGFIIRNSWGYEWADNGHSIYKYEDFGMHYEIWTTIDDKSSEAVIPAKELIRERKKANRRSIIEIIKSLFR